MADYFPNVDLDLFVNSYSKGVADAAKQPSDFTSFFSGLFKGYDDSVQTERVRQQNVIGQNQIDQLPVTNRIHEAEAVQQEAQVAAYQSNPQKYIDAQVAKEDAVIAQQKRDALLQKQETDFLDIMKTGTSAQKAEAIAGSAFLPMFANNPKLYEAAYNSVGTLDAKDRATVFAADIAKKQAESTAKLEGLRAQLLEKSTPKFEENDEINGLALEIDVGKDELLRNGKFKTEQIPGLTPKTEEVKKLNPEGKEYPEQVDVHDPKSGRLVMEPIPRAPGEKQSIKNEQVFVYTNPLTKEEKKIYGISPEARSIFKTHQANYLYSTGRHPEQEGGKVEKQGKQLDDIKEKNAAQAQAQADDLTKNSASYKDHAMSGVEPSPPPDLQVKPKYQAAQAKIEERLSGSKATKAPPSAPPPKETFDPSTVKHEVIVQPRATMAPEATYGPMPEPTYGPPMAPTAPPMTEPEPTLSVSEIKKKEREEIAAARAKFNLEKQPKPAPTTPAPTIAPTKAPGPPATEQAVDTTATPLPTRVAVKVPGPPPSDVVINRVANLKDIDRMPAIGKAVIAAEAMGRNDLVSKVTYDSTGKQLGGVKGIAQMTGDTADEIASGGRRFVTDATKALYMGALKVQLLMDKPELKNNPVLVALGYNGGEALAARAVALAGSTDWNDIQKVLLEAGKPFNFGTKKVKEIKQYVERVISYFPAFMKNAEDKVHAEILKGQGLIDYSSKA